MFLVLYNRKYVVKPALLYNTRFAIMKYKISNANKINWNLEHFYLLPKHFKGETCNEKISNLTVKHVLSNTKNSESIGVGVHQIKLGNSKFE